MRKSELGTLLLILPSVVGFLLHWYLAIYARGHMPTFAGLAATVFEIGGLMALRFVLPLYSLCLLFWAHRGGYLDIRTKVHLCCAMATSAVAWVLLESPR